MKERDLLENLDVNMRIILKSILKKYGRRIGISGEKDYIFRVLENEGNIFIRRITLSF
jgi:hypothetical protein